MRLFPRVKIVLKQNPEALRAFFTMADCVEAIAIAQDDLEILLPRC